MYPSHDQGRLPKQVDVHRGQDRLLPAVRQQRWMAGHLALPLPARQKLRVGGGCGGRSVVPERNTWAQR